MAKGIYGQDNSLYSELPGLSHPWSTHPSSPQMGFPAGALGPSLWPEPEMAPFPSVHEPHGATLLLEAPHPMNSRKEETLQKDPLVGDTTLSRKQAPYHKNWGSSLLPCRSLSAPATQVPSCTYTSAEVALPRCPSSPTPRFVLLSGNSLAPISQVRNWRPV